MTNNVNAIKNLYCDNIKENADTMEVAFRRLYYLDKHEEAFDVLNEGLYRGLAYRVVYLSGYANETKRNDEFEAFRNKQIVKYSKYYKAINKEIPLTLQNMTYSEFESFAKC